MPIDYSKFDNIEDSDEEPAVPAGRGGAGDRGSKDLELLLQHALKQAQEREAAAGAAPDLYEAAGVGRGRRGGVPPPPPPAVPGGGRAAGRGVRGRRGGGAAENPGYDFFDDPFDAYDDPYDPYGHELDDGLGASRSLDYAELRTEAWRLLCSRLVASASPAAAAPSSLLFEAEVHMISSRYRQAIVAALALQLAVATERPAAGAGAYGDWTASTLVIEMVCNYQLGDRNRAVELRSQLQLMDRSNLSGHLVKRFEGTSEVLELVPQFLSLLQAQEQQELVDAREGAKAAGW